MQPSPFRKWSFYIEKIFYPTTRWIDRFYIVDGECPEVSIVAFRPLLDSESSVGLHKFTHRARIDPALHVIPKTKSPNLFTEF